MKSSQTGLSLSPASAKFFLGLFFDPEDGGIMFLLSELHDVTTQKSEFYNSHRPMPLERLKQ
jgi:hypothetical protein